MGLFKFPDKNMEDKKNYQNLRKEIDELLVREKSMTAKGEKIKIIEAVSEEELNTKYNSFVQEYSVYPYLVEEILERQFRVNDQGFHLFILFRGTFLKDGVNKSDFQLVHRLREKCEWKLAEVDRRLTRAGVFMSERYIG